jgi:glycerophosphoryl diester phosphodiesterase
VNRWLRTRPLLIAHRGDSAGAPEQTLTAYRRAIELGADMIEADVHLTRDGVPVMLHDEALDRTTSGHGLVSDVDLAEISRLDAGSWFGAEFAGERVPLLAELLDLADGIGLCLEAKGTSEDGRMEHVALVIAEVIASRDRIDSDVAASFDHDALRRVRSRFPAVAIAPDRLPERGFLAPEALVAQAAAIGAEIIQVHHAELDEAAVAACHAAGIAVWAWPVNQHAEIARSARLGVDGLMGDDVTALVEAMA